MNLKKTAVIIVMMILLDFCNVEGAEAARTSRNVGSGLVAGEGTGNMVKNQMEEVEGAEVETGDLANEQMDEVEGAEVESGKATRYRRKRQNDPRKPDINKEPAVTQRYLKAQDRALSKARRGRAEEFFRPINTVIENAKNIETYTDSKGSTKDAIRVKIPDTHKTKDVLRHLTYYREFMPTSTTTGRQYDLIVDMKMGRDPTTFVLTYDPRVERQIKVGFPKRGKGLDTVYYPTYDIMIDNLNDQARRNAQVILEVINARGNYLNPSWMALSETEWKEAKQIIVITHVAEPAVPDPKEVDEMLDTPPQARLPQDLKGGIGGIDKTARSYFRRIANGDMTFHQVFNSVDGEFIVARTGGKKLMKNGMYRPKNYPEEMAILKRESDALSADSVEQGEPSGEHRRRRSIRPMGGK